MSATVKQQPFTAILSPAFVPRAQTRARTMRRIASLPSRISTTLPVSSIMPVNICSRRFAKGGATLNSVLDARGEKQVHAEPAEFDVTQRKRVLQIRNAFARDAFARIATPNDLWRIEERDAVGKSAEEKRRVHFTTAFHKQARDVFRAELPHQPTQINYAIAQGSHLDSHALAQRGQAFRWSAFRNDNCRQRSESVGDELRREWNPCF